MLCSKLQLLIQLSYENCESHSIEIRQNIWSKERGTDRDIDHCQILLLNKYFQA